MSRFSRCTHVLGIDARAFLVPAFSAFLGGCTTIHIHSNDGVETRRALGIVTIHVPETSRAVVAEMTGLGLIVGQQRATFGWMSESVVAIGDSSRCQVVFVSTTQAQARAVQTVLGEAGKDLGNICFYTKGNQ